MGLIFRIWIKNAPMCNSQLKNPQKRSLNRTKIGKGAQHPRRPIDTLGVPIGPNAWPGPGTSWLTQNLSFFNF